MSIRPLLLKAFLPVLIVVVAGGAILLLLATRPETTAQPLEERAWPVDVFEVRLDANAPVLRLHGFVESPRTSTLRAAVEADVTAVPVKEGERVAAGDVLAVLDPEELELAHREREAEVAELEAQLALEQQRIASDRDDLDTEERLLGIVRRELERVEDLATEAYTSQAELDQASRAVEQQSLAVSSRRLAVEGAEARLSQVRARLDRARALAARAELDLSRATIHAPFGGRILEVRVAPGDRVGPGETLASVYDTDSLEIRAMLVRAHVPRVRQALAGRSLQASAQIDDTRVTVELSRLAGRADPGQGGVDALFTIAPGSDLLVGRFASLELELPPLPDTVLVPYEALYDASRVYRLRNGRMQAVPVLRIGDAPMADGRRGVVLYSEDLENGDQVVTTQLPQAMDGLSVRPVDSGTGG